MSLLHGQALKDLKAKAQKGAIGGLEEKREEMSLLCISVILGK